MLKLKIKRLKEEMGKTPKEKYGYLYLLEMTSINKKENEKFYKIGICNKGVLPRYKYTTDLKYEIKVLVEIPMLYNEALEYERVIKIKYISHIYHPKHPFGGSMTECFDIMPSITKNDNHHIYKYKVCDNKVENVDLGLSIGRNEIELPTIDFNRIHIYLVENISDTYKDVWSRHMIGYSSLQSNKELLCTFGNLIYNIASTKRDINGNKFGAYMPQNMLRLFYDYDFMKGKLKNITKYINPTNSKYWADSIFVFETFSTPNLEKGEDKGLYVTQRLYKVLAHTKYINGENVNLYFINSGICQNLNRELGMEVKSIEWESFLKKYKMGNK